MSASLVGSEMCIRDRPQAAVSQVLPLTFLGFAGLRFRTGFSLAPCHPPVSYTHLTLPTICSV
eukprot:13038641-Alexandrium_andersonii.AAC.1